ncbi:MAG: cytochrome C, partial [Betaproteobacteria bacterium]|nr:cytochrome C [Betaproteobacteria bacterium]
MSRFPRWIFGLIAIGLLVVIPFLYLQPSKTQGPDAAARAPVKRAHVDHRDIVKGVFKSGQDVTRACLVCHEDAAAEVM